MQSVISCFSACGLASQVPPAGVDLLPFMTNAQHSMFSPWMTTQTSESFLSRGHHNIISIERGMETFYNLSKSLISQKLYFQVKLKH